MNYREYVESLSLESLKILADTHAVDYMRSPAWTGNELGTVSTEVIKTFARHKLSREGHAWFG